MASFISGLSLLIFVLINGCFTLPITDVYFPDFTATSFYDDLTTENNFHVRTINGDDLFTTPFNDIKRSEDEEVFSSTETNPTVSTDLKRFLSEPESFTVSAAPVQFESATDASRQERISEEPFTFTETTEQSAEQKRDHEEPITFTDSYTTEELITVPHEHETDHQKRGFQDEDVTTQSIETSSNGEIESQFTSTSSAVAPELYTSESTEFSFIQTSTTKYVGSFVDPEEDHNTDNWEDSRKDDKKPEDEEHREEEHNENVDDTNEKLARKTKRPTSVDETSEDSSANEKYVFADLYDQGSSKFRPTLASDFAILDESVVPVTAKLVRPSTTTTVASDEDNKLNQGEESS